MASKFVQPFILKSGDIENKQPNYNGPNYSLETVYNRKKCEWVKRFANTKSTTSHMKKSIVEMWDEYKLDEEKIIIKSLK